MVGGQRHVPATLIPGKTQYPLSSTLDGTQGGCGQVRKISPPPGFDPRTVQPTESRCTEYVIKAHPSTCFISKTASWIHLKLALGRTGVKLQLMYNFNLISYKSYKHYINLKSNSTSFKMTQARGGGGAGFDLRSAHMSFVVDRVALGHVSITVRLVSPVSIISLTIHTH
jgi:hypothetical protein